MTRQLKAKKFAKTKRLLNPKSTKCKPTKPQEQKAITPNNSTQHQLPQDPSQLFFHYNPALGPPYRLLLDTNFLNLSYQNKLDIFKSSMDCLLGKCIPIVTECVIAEMEKLGNKSRLALKLVKDPRFVKVTCQHKGTYADDCIVNRVTQHRCFIVCTCDKDLKRRIRKIPGVPIMYIQAHKYTIERMPEAYGAPK